jgi:hypothetical protein
MSATQTLYKNPLAQAFGIVLRRQRDIMDKTSDEVADILGIGRSFYRLIESGTNNMHVSKTIALVDAFEERIKFDAVSKILMAISFMEVSAKRAVEDGMHYAEGLKLAVEKLAEYDQEKLHLLFKPFIDNKIFDQIKSASADNIAALIESHNLDKTLSDFLMNYEHFGQSSEHVQNEFLNTFFDNIPTYYVEFLTNMRENLLSLPVRIGFRELNNNWEVKHQDNFTHLYAVVRHPTQILHLENLKNYQFKYLWGENFKAAKFIFVENNLEGKEITTSVAKDLFTKNLKQSYDLTGGVPDDFDDKLRKIEFKVATENDRADYLELLRNVDEEDNLQIDFYDATWAFTLLNSNSVGFQSKEELQKADFYRLKEGICLNYISTFSFIKNFKALWDKMQ